MRGKRVGAPLALVIWMHAIGVAHADEPTSLEPSAYMRVYGGPVIASGGVTAAIGNRTYEADSRTGPLGWRAGIAATYWFNEVVGIDVTGAEFFGYHLGTVRVFDRCSGGASCVPANEAKFSAVGARTTVGLRLGLPLRYFKPYVGAGVSMQVAFLTANDPASGDSIDTVDHGMHFPLSGGASFYLSRTLRLIADYQLVLKDLYGIQHQEKGPPVSIAFRDLQTHAFSLGLEFSDVRWARDQNAIPMAPMAGFAMFGFFFALIASAAGK